MQTVFLGAVYCDKRCFRLWLWRLRKSIDMALRGSRQAIEGTGADKEAVRKTTSLKL